MSRFGEYLNVSSIRGITATVLFIDQVEGEVSGDKNEKTLYELINCET